MNDEQLKEKYEAALMIQAGLHERIDELEAQLAALKSEDGGKEGDRTAAGFAAHFISSRSCSCTRPQKESA